MKKTEGYTARSQAGEVWHRLRKNVGAMVGLAIIIVIAFIAIFADQLMDYDTDVIGQNIAERMMKPCKEHPFGTDELGRDIFCRVLYGSRISLSVGLVAVAVGLTSGLIFGSFAGYFGGVVEDVIMRVRDVLGAVPSILMGIVIVAALGASKLNLMIAIGVSSVPGFISTVRTAVMTVKNSDYIEAARAVGRTEWEIIAKHVLPNCLSPIIVYTTLHLASAIISASSLSFLGLGVPVPSPEWGALLSAGRKFVRSASYMTLYPGLAIVITVLAFNMFGDGLRDSMDPKLRR